MGAELSSASHLPNATAQPVARRDGDMAKGATAIPAEYGTTLPIALYSGVMAVLSAACALALRPHRSA